MAAGFPGSIYRAQDREKVEYLCGPPVEAKAHGGAPAPGRGIVRPARGGASARLPVLPRRRLSPPRRPVNPVKGMLSAASVVVKLVLEAYLDKLPRLGGTRPGRCVARVHAERGRGVASRKGVREFPALDLAGRSLGDGSDPRWQLRALRR